MNIRGHLDLFSGVGGFSLALERAGVKPDWIGYSDIDKYSNKVFKRRFPHAERLGSITDIQTKDLPRIDLITFGFPCQDLSMAAGNRRKGFKGDRSSLFFEAIKIIRDAKPKYFIFENVKGFFSSNKGEDFTIALQTIADIGYDGQWQLLNTRWFLPQNRERIYFVGHIRGECRPKVFPIGETSEIINNRNTKIENNSKIANTLQHPGHSGGNYKGMTMIDTGLKQIGTIGNKNSEAMRVYDTNGISKTIKDGGGMGAKTGLYRVDDVNLIAKKRMHDTPKEINAYLKKYKDRTINEIAKELKLPKTQIEHYFREDKYRAIPPPKIWLQLKELLGLDDTYDKEVTEIYEKEYEFESSKRVYSEEGIAQTLSTSSKGLYKVKSVAHRTRSYKGQKACIEERNDNISNCLNSQTKDYMVKVNSLNKNQTNKLNKLKVDSSVSGTLTEAIGRGGSSSEYLKMLKKNKELTGSIRRLTPLETCRLQGFPDDWNDCQSDTQRYKQMGNAVTVDVVEAIYNKLYNLG